LSWYEFKCSDILFSVSRAVWDINVSVEEGRWYGEYLYYWLRCWRFHLVMHFCSSTEKP
jgi:hypothetical protein